MFEPSSGSCHVPSKPSERFRHFRRNITCLADASPFGRALRDAIIFLGEGELAKLADILAYRFRRTDVQRCEVARGSAALLAAECALVKSEAVDALLLRDYRAAQRFGDCVHGPYVACLLSCRYDGNDLLPTVLRKLFTEGMSRARELIKNFEAGRGELPPGRSILHPGIGTAHQYPQMAEKVAVLFYPFLAKYLPRLLEQKRYGELGEWRNWSVEIAQRYPGVLGGPEVRLDMHRIFSKIDSQIAYFERHGGTLNAARREQLEFAVGRCRAAFNKGFIDEAAPLLDKLISSLGGNNPRYLFCAFDEAPYAFQAGMLKLKVLRAQAHAAGINGGAAQQLRKAARQLWFALERLTIEHKGALSAGEVAEWKSYLNTATGRWLCDGEQERQELAALGRNRRPRHSKSA